MARAVQAGQAGQTPPKVMKDEEFQSKFRQLLELNATDDLATLVRANQELAINYVNALADSMALKNSDLIEKQFQALIKAWKDGMKSSFVEKEYLYLSDLVQDGARLNERTKLKAAFNVTLGKFTDNNKDKRLALIYDQSAAEFTTQGAAFEQIGDMYFAARCAGAAAVCLDDSFRTDPNLPKACEQYGRAVRFFDQVDLHYTYYLQLKEHYDKLVKDGFGAPPPGPDPGAAAADPKAAAAPPLTSKMTFEMIKTIDEFDRPNYYCDEVYQIWPAVYLQAKGSAGQFASMEQLEKKGPTLLRTAAAQLAVDLDHNGTPDKTIPLTGNAALVDLTIGEGENQRPWAFLCRTGIQEDVYQGLKTNLQPDDNQVILYTINAASVVGTLGTTKVRVLDDNMDGVYGSEPKSWNFRELSNNAAQPDMDSVVVGDGKRARPWSQYQEIAGAWYEMTPAKGGLELTATPVTLPIGTLRIDYKGDAPLWMVVKGAGPLEKCYFDLMLDPKKGINVPVGTYALFCGEMRNGKKAQTAKSLVLPGATTPRWVVTAGKETLVKLGAPYGFDFSTEPGDDKVTVKGKTVTIIGSAGERYDRTWNCAPRPEMSARKPGQKKGGKPEKMGIVLDLQEVGEDGVQKHKFEDTWRPLDTSVPIKKGETVEVQLSEKKNKLFGEIESAWK
jgi:hypothetical protein